ncbi:MAG: 50S ribosomal protein L35 [Candidatus Hydrogenedentes bacterium]|nr:50S ribosomal protein L35 [Candidatus Hydrogenedentota bacterium]
MPKLKTNKATAKRFRTTKQGKILRSKAFGRHLLTGKSSKRRRRLRKQGLVSDADQKRISRLLPYG